MKEVPPRSEEELQHNEQSKLVLGGEGAGDRTKVRYANFDDEMIGMTTTITNEDSGGGGGAFGSQVRSSASPKKIQSCS